MFSTVDCAVHRPLVYLPDVNRSAISLILYEPGEILCLWPPSLCMGLHDRLDPVSSFILWQYHPWNLDSNLCFVLCCGRHFIWRNELWPTSKTVYHTLASPYTKHEKTVGYGKIWNVNDHHIHVWSKSNGSVVEIVEEFHGGIWAKTQGDWNSSKMVHLHRLKPSGDEESLWYVRSCASSNK